MKTFCHTRRPWRSLDSYDSGPVAPRQALNSSAAGLAATIARAVAPNSSATAIDLGRGSEVWPRFYGTPHCCSGEGPKSSCCVLTRAGRTQPRRNPDSHRDGTRPITLTPLPPGGWWEREGLCACIGGWQGCVSGVCHCCSATQATCGLSDTSRTAVRLPPTTDRSSRRPRQGSQKLAGGRAKRHPR